MTAAALRTEDVTSFAAACEWTGVRADEDEREAWLDMRKTMLTASDIAAILGEDPHKSALDVYLDKVTESRAEVLALDDPRFWGNVLEQPVLRAVARYRGWKYRQGGALLRSRKHPFLGATLDAEIDRGDGVWIDLEGKTTRLPRGWDEESGELPTRVLIQVQAQLLVTGAPLAIVFALLQGSRPVQIPIEPSPAFHEVIAEHGAEFMTMVERGNPPLPDGKPSATRALSKLYPSEDGSVVLLPRDALTWTKRLQSINARLRFLERRKEHFQQLLKHSIGKATFGILPEEVGSKRCWRWQTQEREAYAVENTSARVLIALKDAPRVRGPIPVANDTLVEALEESVAVEQGINDGTTTKIRYGQRRRSKR